MACLAGRPTTALWFKCMTSLLDEIIDIQQHNVLVSQPGECM